MATFYYSANQNPPSPPAYIEAATPSAAANKWYDPDRTWGEYWKQWENYFGYEKKRDQSDHLPYDHAFPYGVDPNNPYKPYAPYGFYCDKNGNETTPVICSQKYSLEEGLQQHPDPSDPESPLNVYNIESPMDPYNMRQFFYAEKPGSPWHEYEREPDQMEPSSDQPSLPGYIKYPDSNIAFKDTPENFPWLHDQDPSHHYRRDQFHLYYYSTIIDGSFYLIQPQPNITEKIYLDSPVAPAGWRPSTVMMMPIPNNNDDNLFDK